MASLQELEIPKNTYPKRRTLYARKIFGEFFEGRSAEDEYLCMDFIRHGKKKEKIKVIRREGSDKSSHVYFKNITRLGEIDSRDAEAYKVCLPVFFLKDTKEFVCPPNVEYFLSVKIIPLSKDEVNYPGDLEFYSWRELKALTILTEYIVREINPNLPFLYSHGICRKFNTKVFQNKNLREEFRDYKKFKHLEALRNKTPSERRLLTRIKNRTRDFSGQTLLIFNEIADKDLGQWFTANSLNLTPSIIKSLIFQVMAGLIAVHDEGIIHSDLHLSNVLMSQVLDVYYFYELEGEKFYIPLHKNLFKIWDFGRCIFLEYASTRDIFNKVKKLYKSAMLYPRREDFIAIEDALERDLTCRFKLAQSRDVYQILSYILGELRAIIRSGPQKAMFADLFIELKKMVSDAYVDLNNLPNKHSVKPQGSPRNIIKKYFNEFKTLPIQGVVVNPDLPFRLTREAFLKTTKNNLVPDKPKEPTPRRDLREKNPLIT